MCLYSKLIKNPKYVGNKKNGFRPPRLEDKRVEYVPIGCGKCIECMKQKANEWRIRLMEEIKRPISDEKANFVTLTFSEEGMAEVERMAGSKIANIVATKAVRLFLERWRRKYKRSVRHWFITEIGEVGTMRLHIHGIMWTNRSEAEIQERWQYGEVRIGGVDKLTGKHENYVNERTINYIVKYVVKVNETFKDYTPKVLTSKGIGSRYMESNNVKLNEYKDEGTNEAYRLNNGQKVGLPIYYRNKIYSEEEREALWIEKTDKEERYVLGRKYDVSTKEGETAYERALMSARAKNKRIGYSDDRRSDEQVYTRNERVINIKRKLKNDIMKRDIKKVDLDLS